MKKFLFIMISVGLLFIVTGCGILSSSIKGNINNSRYCADAYCPSRCESGYCDCFNITDDGEEIMVKCKVSNIID